MGPTFTYFEVTLYPNLSHAAMIAAGNYDYVDETIGLVRPEDHPSLKKASQDNIPRVLRMALAHYEIEDVGNFRVRNDFGKLGYRPSSFGEGCGFAAKHPQVQGLYPIAILNSRWRASSPILSYHGYYVAVLGKDRGRRTLGQSEECPGDGWDGHTRFLGTPL